MYISLPLICNFSWSQRQELSLFKTFFFYAKPPLWCLRIPFDVCFLLANLNMFIFLLKERQQRLSFALILIMLIQLDILLSQIVFLRHSRRQGYWVAQLAICGGYKVSFGKFVAGVHNRVLKRSLNYFPVVSFHDDQIKILNIHGYLCDLVYFKFENWPL